MVFLGVESFDEKQLKFFRKRSSLAVNKEAIEILQTVGIDTRVGLINFYRESTLEQIRTNFGQIEALHLEAAIPTPASRLMVYKNTPLYRSYMEQGVGLIPAGNDSFAYEFLDKKVGFLFDGVKILADRTYPLMKHFRELQEMEYYFHSALSEKAKEVFTNLKKIEFDYFKDVLAIVEDTPEAKLTDLSEAITGLAENYYNQMMREITWFNRWVENNQYEARYDIPGIEQKTEDPMGRLYDVIESNGDAWVAIGDFLKLWDRNSVYGRTFMDVFIAEVVSAANMVCSKHGGFAVHLVADEILMSLPKEISASDAREIFKEVHEMVFRYFSGKYGFARIEINDEMQKKEVVEYLRQHPAVKGIDVMPILDETGEGVDKYYILFKNGGKNNNEVLQDILSNVKEKCSGEIDFEVLTPWIPIGAAKASYVPREENMSVEAWINRVVEEADFMQHYAKEEIGDLVAISDKPTALMRHRDDNEAEIKLQFFDEEELASANEVAKRTRRLLENKKYRVDRAYPSFDQHALRSVVRDSLFYSGREVVVCKLDVGYEAFDGRVYDSFKHSSSTRELRKSERGEPIFGFKAIQGTFGHDIGDQVILMLNMLIDEQFRQNPAYSVNIIRGPPDKFYMVFEKSNGELPTVENISKCMDRVKTLADEKLERLGIKSVLDLSTISAGSRDADLMSEKERDDKVRTIIQALNLTSESRSVISQVQVKTPMGITVKDFKEIENNDTLRQLLIKENRTVVAHQRKRSKDILCVLNEKLSARDVRDKNTNSDKKPVVLMLGYPASGKGTIGKKVAQKMGFSHMSMGDIMRGLMKAVPSLNVDECPGLGFAELGAMIRKGQINIDNGIVLDSNAPVPGWKTEFEKFLSDNNLYLVAMVHVEIEEKVARERMRERQRADDFRKLKEDPKKEMIELRMRNHAEKVVPLVEYYKNEELGITVDNNVAATDEMLDKKVNVVVEKVLDKMVPRPGKSDGNDDENISQNVTLKQSKQFNENIKVIKKNHRSNMVAFKRVEKYLGQIMAEQGNADLLYPVDIVVDLALMPEEGDELREYMETWAYLILMCRDLRNVNFIFEYPDKEEATRAEINAVMILKDKIKAQANIYGDLSDLADKRINVARRENAIEIMIFSKDYLESARAEHKALESNQYPVAMERMAPSGTRVVLIANFQAALNIGLINASLVIAEKRDESRGDSEYKEFSELKKNVLSALQGLYNAFLGDNIVLTEKTLDNMVSEFSSVRLNLAISLALPPLVKIAAKYLEDCHREIRLLLLSA
ncbi:MAG TPA: AAA family ATPase [Candidatus Omnitrophota bacterium]|nr:AAA family ATPase [Candidatus Omnitrophota bacterium]HPS19477.1 AAA family ATPase [Candidatus Omnitrophota bacterium]